MKRIEKSSRRWLALFPWLLVVGLVHAQADWHPDRPVTLVVPYAAGGGTDANARAIAQRLSEIWLNRCSS